MSGVQSSASDSATDVEHGAVTAGKAPAVEPPPSKLHAWWAKWYAGVLFGSALTIVFLTVVIVIVIVSNPVNNTTVCKHFPFWAARHFSGIVLEFCNEQAAGTLYDQSIIWALDALI